MGKQMNAKGKHSSLQTEKSKFGYYETARVYHPLILFFALLLLTAFPHQYPHAAFPLNAIFINIGLLSILAGTLIAGFYGTNISKESKILLYLYALFTLWCLLRNYLSPVPAFGRPFVGMVFEGFWILATTLLVLSFEKSPGSGEKHPFGILIRDTQGDFSPHVLSLHSLFVFYFIVLAITFSLLGVYQYFMGFERQLELLQQGSLYSDEDSVSQGIIHALRERRVLAGFGNPNLFAAFLCMSLPFFLFLLVERESRGLTMVSIGGLILLLFVMILTRSRGGLLSLLFSVFLFYILIFKNKKSGAHLLSSKRFLPVIIILFFLIIIFLVIQNATKTRDIRGSSLPERLFTVSTIRERRFYILTGWEIIKEFPILGAGPGGYALHYPLHRQFGARETQYAHNFIIQLWAELGLVGLILFFAFVIYCIKVGLRHPQTQRLKLLPLIAFLIFLFNSLFEYTFYHSALYLDFCLCAGMVVGGPSAQDSTIRGRKPVPPRLTADYLYFLLPVLLSLIFFPAFNFQPFLGATQAQFGDDVASGGEMEKALRFYNSAISYQPDNPWYHYKIGKTYLSLGNPVKAEDALKKAHELNPYSALLRDELSQLYQITYRRADAIKMAQGAIKAYPLKAQYHFHLAQLLLEQGDKEGARKEAQEAVRCELDPNVQKRYKAFAENIGR